MNIIEAAKLVKQGKSLRNGKYSSMYPDMFSSKWAELPGFDLEDILSENWELDE